MHHNNPKPQDSHILLEMTKRVDPVGSTRITSIFWRGGLIFFGGSTLTFAISAFSFPLSPCFSYLRQPFSSPPPIIRALANHHHHVALTFSSSSSTNQPLDSNGKLSTLPPPHLAPCCRHHIFTVVSNHIYTPGRQNGGSSSSWSTDLCVCRSLQRR